jgi:hypothetical protein
MPELLACNHLLPWLKEKSLPGRKQSHAAEFVDATEKICYIYLRQEEATASHPKAMPQGLAEKCRLKQVVCTCFKIFGEVVED